MPHAFCTAPTYLATATVAARCHASDETEGSHLAFSGLVGVEVRAVLFVRALVPEEMDVAHLYLLDAVHFDLVVVLTWWVDALTGAIASDDFLAISRLVCGRRVVDRRRWSSDLGSPVHRQHWLGCCNHAVRGQCRC